MPKFTASGRLESFNWMCIEMINISTQMHTHAANHMRMRTYAKNAQRKNTLIGAERKVWLPEMERLIACNAKQRKKGNKNRKK